MSIINLNVGLSGHFKFFVHKPGEEPRKVAEFDNLILDAGFERMQAGAYLTTCRVGSGTTPPAATDTALQTHVASTTTKHVADSYSHQTTTLPHYGQVSITFRFAQGAAAGNLSEVGVGWGTTTETTLFSRALITDSAGTATTITVATDEILDVVYELRYYVPGSDVTSTMTIGGVSTTVTLRPAGTTGFWAPANQPPGFNSASYVYNHAFVGPIGEQTGGPTGTAMGSSEPDTRTTEPYVAGSKYRDFTLGWSINRGNDISGGIGAIRGIFINAGAWQVGFSPSVAKDNTKTFTVKIRVTYSRR